MSKPPTLSPESETGPYKFHSPIRIAITFQQPCFACSHKLKDVAVKAVCEQDDLVRIFHVRCWESNAIGGYGTQYRWNKRRDADERARMRALASIADE